MSQKSGHLNQLDSLRGIAAIMVIFFHSCLPFSGIKCMGTIGNIFGAGPVLLFFVLSGYVLSSSLLRTQKISALAISAFYIRRFFRIYPAVIISILFGILLSFYYPIISKYEYPALEFLLRKSSEVRSLKSLFNEITLREVYANSPLWTIQVELACSLVFPFLVWTVVRFPKINIPIAIVLAVLMTKAKGCPDWGFSVCWLFPFFMGYQAVKWKTFFQSKLQGSLLWIFILLALLISFIFGKGGIAAMIYSIFFGCLILSIAIRDGFPYDLLRTKKLIFLGRISFSVYLIHMPVILFVWSALYHFFPEFLASSSQIWCASMIFIITLIITIILSVLNQALVEKPWNDLGHRLSYKWLNFCHPK